MGRGEETVRCSKCILPSCLPDSDFDERGECSWCRSGFPNYVPLGEEKLLAILDAARNRSGVADCLVGVSGGKDSSYALLELTQKYGMRAEAFTYTHDGLNDFALENAANVCRAMGVRHHIVSLPDHKHRDTFIAFFEAWLESEEPVTAAVTCVACKHFHILGSQIASERGIPLVVWASCPLEVPPFLPTRPRGARDTKSRGATSLAGLFLRQVAGHRAFRKAFLRDIPLCVAGCLSFRPDSAYLALRYPSVEHMYYFKYVQWDAGRIVDTLVSEASWRPPSGAASGWHADCKFHPLKEYMFQKMVGATYADAYISNQVRHDLMTRDQAWREMVASRESLTEDLARVIDELDLHHLRPRIDLDCFALQAH